MKRKKLLKTLSEFFDADGRKQRKHRTDLADLLKKLKTKEFDLEKKLLTAKDDYKRQRLNKELEIVRAQYQKGMTTLEGLEDS